MKLWFKKLAVPRTNETREIDAVQLWEVRWWSRHGWSGPDYVKATPQLECFTSEKEAIDFKESLENAFQLLRYGGTGIDVQVTKAK